VSIAGILANLILATIAFTVFKIILHQGGFGLFPDSLQEPVGILLRDMLVMNISLAVFNLLPFPPLDGSKVLDTFLPASARPLMEIFEQYGFIILMVLIYLGVLNAIISPVISAVAYLLFLGVR
jgi:Zn-dependent protease